MSSVVVENPVLQVSDLEVAYGGIPAVKGVSFDIGRAQSLALIGESGSGKSSIANAILGVWSSARVDVSGEVRLGGNELSELSGVRRREVLNREIGYIPQDPGNSLNPVRPIGSQLADGLRAGKGSLSRDDERARIVDALERVHLSQIDRVLASYPHQLSGGMLQRVLVAAAILNEPSLLIADEPTSALDVTIQRHILDLIDQLREELGLAVLLITHDLHIATQRADQVLVLQSGTVQEVGAPAAVLDHPTSAYARQLFSDVPAFNLGKYDELKVRRSQRGERGRDIALAVSNVSKTFVKGSQRFAALTDVDVEVGRGLTHALVGESGSGKTTLGRIILGLERADTGTVDVDGHDVGSLKRGALRELHRNLQVVYQNPYTSLDPTYTVGRAVSEPLKLHRLSRGSERERTTRELLAAVGLPPESYDRRPESLSGGQRQRVAIARALALNPRIVVLDEPTSALDVTVQAQILDLLIELQESLDATFVFITHDLSLVRQFADTVTVLKEGRVRETGPVTEVFKHPKDAYTERLLEASLH